MKTAEEFIVDHYGQPQDDMEAEQLKEFAELMEEYEKAKAGQVDTSVIGLPPLQEMEGEILDALENLDVIVHADKPMIGNRFATASSIYKVFKNKIDQ